MHISLDELQRQIQWVQFPEIHVFLHPEMLEFCVVDELSCWGCELEIEC